MKKMLFINILIILFFCHSTYSYTTQKNAKPNFRGTNNSIQVIKLSDVQKMEELGINLIRINFGLPTTYCQDNGLSEDPFSIYQGSISKLDQIINQCSRLNIKVIIAADKILGRNKHDFWSPKNLKANIQHLSKFWYAIASKYRGYETIWGYDILNEPDFKENQTKLWNETILPKVILNIRAVDKKVNIIIEPGRFGMAQGFKRQKFISGSNIIYSFHHYAPHSYTHQGIKKYTEQKWILPYPGVLKMFGDSQEQFWDKNSLLRSFKDAIEFQNKYNCRMLVGEFGVIRTAVGKEHWIKDSIEIFEEHGWDWCLHSLTGWNGFNPFLKNEISMSFNNHWVNFNKDSYFLLKYWKLNK